MPAWQQKSTHKKPGTRSGDTEGVETYQTVETIQQRKLWLQAEDRRDYKEGFNEPETPGREPGGAGVCVSGAGAEAEVLPEWEKKYKTKKVTKIHLHNR